MPVIAGAALITAGDSMTLGLGAAFAYGDYIFADFGLPALYIKGHSGAGWITNGGEGTLTALAPTDVDVRVADVPQPFLILFAGGNDLNNGETSTAVINAFSTYVQARITAGWQRKRIIVNTMPSRSGISSSERLAYNTGMANLQGTHGYYIARLDLDSRIGPDGAYADTTYFGDGVHPTTAGQRVIADLDEAIVAAVMPLRFRVYA